MFILLIVAFLIGTFICISGRNTQHTDMAASIREATEIDVYLFGKHKITYLATLEYSNGIREKFGVENSDVFGKESDANQYDELSLPNGNSGFLLRFCFPDNALTLDVYCTNITNALSSKEDDLTSCFVDIESDKIYLVESSVGFKLDEPDISTKKFHEIKGKYLSIKDNQFFLDILQLLRENYHV